jgi:hypothetical protein
MSESRVSGIGPETPHGTVIEPMRSGWRTRREDKARRLDRVAKVVRGRVLPTEKIVPALEALVARGDRVAVEGNNQKQADFLSRSLAAVDSEKVHDLHMLISSISRPDHLDLFERDIVALVAAESADAEGNLYTGSNTEDTPTIVEATAFRRDRGRAGQRAGRGAAPRGRSRIVGGLRGGGRPAIRG